MNFLWQKLRKSIWGSWLVRESLHIVCEAGSPQGWVLCPLEMYEAWPIQESSLQRESL